MSIEDTASNISAPVLKTASAWAAVGIASWADLASAMQAIASGLAAIYTAILIGEWAWKKFGYSYAVKRGWIKITTEDAR